MDYVTASAIDHSLLQLEYLGIVLFRQIQYKYRGGLLSGIKLTNDLESLINSATVFRMLSELYPTAIIQMLETMGDDVLLIFDILTGTVVSQENIVNWFL